MADALISVEEAVDRLLAAASPVTGRERAALPDALGRIAAQNVFAQLDQPPFDRSPLDGFAMHHEDTVEASAENPVRLPVVMEVYAGDAGDVPLERGCAARILTGAPMPPGADCMVRQEDVTRENGIVSVPVRLAKYENYVFRGEQYAAGVPLVREGERLDPGWLALLAGDGRATVPVFSRPRVAVISTGNELVPPGCFPETAVNGPAGTGDAGTGAARGCIHDSNRILFAARAVELGAIVPVQVSERDDPDAIARALTGALKTCDVLITTGGISVGTRDYLPLAGENAGMRQLFHGVAIKPGTHALALEKEGKIALCLSGNPFAAFVTFELLGAPLVRRLGGWAEPRTRRTTGMLMRDFPKGGGMRRCIPARMQGGEVFLSPAEAASRSPASLAGVNCLVDLPAGSRAPEAGNMVEVALL